MRRDAMSMRSPLQPIECVGASRSTSTKASSFFSRARPTSVRAHEVRYGPGPGPGPGDGSGEAALSMRGGAARTTPRVGTAFTCDANEDAERERTPCDAARDAGNRWKGRAARGSGEQRAAVAGRAVAGAAGAEVRDLAHRREADDLIDRGLPAAEVFVGRV